MSLDALQIFKTSSEGEAGLLEEKLKDSDFLIYRTRPEFENTGAASSSSLTILISSIWP